MCYEDSHLLFFISARWVWDLWERDTISSQALADGQDKSCLFKLGIGVSMYASEFYLLFLWKVFERLLFDSSIHSAAGRFDIYCIRRRIRILL